MHFFEVHKLLRMIFKYKPHVDKMKSFMVHCIMKIRTGIATKWRWFFESDSLSDLNMARIGCYLIVGKQWQWKRPHDMIICRENMKHDNAVIFAVNHPTQWPHLPSILHEYSWKRFSTSTLGIKLTTTIHKQQWWRHAILSHFIHL